MNENMAALASPVWMRALPVISNAGDLESLVGEIGGMVRQEYL